MARLGLRLLGGFQLSRESRPVALPAKKARALLAYLALRPGRPHARETLTTLLWGDTSEQKARQSLRQTLSRLRKVFAIAHNAGLVVRGETVSLHRPALEVDVAVFERLARAGTAAALASAADLYQGSLLEGLTIDEPTFDEWLQAERERLHEAALDALSRLLAHQARSAGTELAVRTALRLLALDPLLEAVHRTLMRLYVRQGRRGAALRQYQTCLTVLQRELGVEPEPETKRLYQEILQKSAPSPARGLPRAFREAEVGAGRSSGPAAEPPLIGRTEEVARLRTALADAWQGRSGIVVLTGEAGVGKSRLIEELAVEGLRRNGRLLRGQCYESEQILPYRPWIDALRSGQILADVETTRDIGPNRLAELGRLFPELGPSRGLFPATPESHTRLFDALCEVVRCLAARQPLLLILEDLHWADEMSLRLLAFIARRVERRPVLILGTAREEELPWVPALTRMIEELNRERRLSRAILPSLSREATTELVRALARRGTSASRVAELGEQVWAGSEGNPFVIVETMRALEEGQVLAAGTGISLPQRVRELVSTRLNRLSAGSQPLAEVAAVIGREFSFALLRQAAGLSEHETAAAVEELVRRRLLEAVGEHFAFSHQWARDVIYSQVLSPRRLALHGAVGAAMEALHADRLDEVSDQLADHFSHTDQTAKAIHYLVRLSEKAARSYALDDAVRTLRHALVQVERLPDAERGRCHVEVIFHLAHALFLLGRIPEIVDLLVKEQHRLEELHDPLLSGHYHFWLGYVYGGLGESERAVQNAQRAIEEAARCGDQATMGMANYVLSRECHWAGRLRQGVAHGRQAVALLEGTGERWWLGQALHMMALNLGNLGDFTPALRALAWLADLGDTLSDTRLQTYAAWHTGWIYALVGECDTAIETCRRGAALAPDPLSGVLAQGFLGGAHLEKGDPGEAITCLEKSLRQLRSFIGAGAPRYRDLEGYFTAMLSEAYLLQGRTDEAHRAALDAFEVASKCRWQTSLAYAERALAKIALTAGAPRDAEAHLHRALDIFSSIDFRFHVARTHVMLAEVGQSRGDGTAALTHLQAAYDLFKLLRVSRYIEQAEKLATTFGVALT
jgi:DNA-binding SARP family transcriptional activator